MRYFRLIFTPCDTTSLPLRYKKTSWRKYKVDFVINMKEYERYIGHEFIFFINKN